jgi:hypothetical protein
VLTNNEEFGLEESTIRASQPMQALQEILDDETLKLTWDAVRRVYSGNGKHPSLDMSKFNFKELDRPFQSKESETNFIRSACKRIFSYLNPNPAVSSTAKAFATQVDKLFERCIVGADITAEYYHVP